MFPAQSWKHRLLYLHSCNDSGLDADCIQSGIITRMFLLLFLEILLVFFNIVDVFESKEAYLNPSLMPKYKEIRKQCKWMVHEKEDKGCAVKRRETCIVDVKHEGNSGYYHFTRFGPFTSQGGYKETLCESFVFRGLPGEIIIHSIAGPLDPLTEEFISFPPLHFHHTRIVETFELLDSIRKYSKYLYFLDDVKGNSDLKGKCERKVCVPLVILIFNV
jgi:hypothetical protein